MRALLVAVALVPSLLAARPAPAVPFTDAFLVLQADLETRRDNDFGGDLDAAQVKQRKAVLKSLALLAKPSDGALHDFQTFIQVAGAIAKGYPEEVAAGFDSPLWFD